MEGAWAGVVGMMDLQDHHEMASNGLHGAHAVQFPILSPDDLNRVAQASLTLPSRFSNALHTFFIDVNSPDNEVDRRSCIFTTLKRSATHIWRTHGSLSCRISSEVLRLGVSSPDLRYMR